MSDDKVSKGGFNHDRIETSNGLMILLILLVVAIGGLVEIVPLFFQKSTTEPVTGLQPYTALQLMGRDVYPPPARRSAALRPLLGGGRVCL